ncbi:MAG: hypothetical protein Q7S43_01970 [bacterium]|nr:hypothetical protein [bacterium]
MNILSKVIVLLVFILAGVLFFHNLTSINADVGRHIGLGELIWKTKEVPKTNLLSFTAPDFPFINHHWLSEVAFYGVYSIGDSWLSGLRSVMIFKMIILLATYFLLFLAVKRHNIFAVVLAFLVSIFVFAARTEPRPEIFSYLIFAAYLLIIYRARSRSDFKNPQGRTFDWLWLLPVLQLFWVNLHIYFIIGPVIYFFFLTEKAILKNINKQDLLIGLTIVLANFVNPNFIEGALYPLRVFNNYGYSVAENSSLLFLAKYFGQWAPQDKLFLVSVFILAGSFILSFWKNKLKIKTRIFDLMLVTATVALSFKMQRNIPLYALSLWPVMAKNLNDFSNFEKLKKWLYALAIFILIGNVYLVVSGRFYNWLDSAKTFGLNVSGAAQEGTDFVKVNKIQGPVFNNFDIGSYLAWQLYPDQKVFIDGRPEAYPVEFFDKIYKPMQRDEKVWQEMSEKYGINYVFFAHTDMTEWADEFLTSISRDKEWSMVFLNDAVVVFVKDIEINQSVIGKYQITEQNIVEKLSQVLDKLNKKDDNAFINFGNALYRFRWLNASAKVYEALIVNQPNNPYGYQGAGYAYATMNDPATQEKAYQNLKKAIDLGFKTFNNYLTLGIINANLGNFIEAEENLIRAVKINPDNQNAKSVLESVRIKQGLVE